MNLRMMDSLCRYIIAATAVNIVIAVDAASMNCF